jgi:Mg-chelatase subunit ChlD
MRLSNPAAPIKHGSLQIRCVPERQSVALIKGESKPQGVLVEVRGLDAAKITARPAIAVLPVVDISSSMKGEKLQTACRALDSLLDEMRPDDTWGLVAFDKRPQLISAPHALSDTQRAQARHALRTLRPGYLTNLSGGLLQAFDVARGLGQQRIVILLLSDGLPSYGVQDERELELLTAAAVRGGLVVSTFGYGAGCDDVLLTRIARAGGGRYTFVRDLADVSTAFHAEVGASRMLAAQHMTIALSTDAGVVERLLVGDVLAGQTKRRLAELPGRKKAKRGPAKLATASCEWTDATGHLQKVGIDVPIQFVEQESESAPDREVEREREFARVRDIALVAEARLRNGPDGWREAVADVLRLLETLKDEEARAFAQWLLEQYRSDDLDEGRAARSNRIAGLYDAKSVSVDD